MRKRKAFAGIFALNFKIACEFLTKNSRGAFSPEVFIEHFNACIIQYLWRKDNKKWEARININKKQVKLGCFHVFEDAVVARLKAEKKYYGEFAPQKHLYEQYGIV